MVKFQRVAPISGIFSALADPTRVAMLARLDAGPATVGELGAPFPISGPAVLKHVRALEAAGVIRTTKQGRTRVCSLEPRALDAAASWIHDRREAWSTRLDALGRVLDERGG